MLNLATLLFSRMGPSVSQVRLNSSVVDRSVCPWKHVANLRPDASSDDCRVAFSALKSTVFTDPTGTPLSFSQSTSQDLLPAG